MAGVQVLGFTEQFFRGNTKNLAQVPAGIAKMHRLCQDNPVKAADVAVQDFFKIGNWLVHRRSCFEGFGKVYHTNAPASNRYKIL